MFKKYLVVYAETVSVLFIKNPIILNGMITMKNEFHSKQTLIETKMFLFSVVYALDTTVRVFKGFQQNLL